MASNTSPQPTGSPLSFMNKLSTSIYLVRPKPSIDSGNSGLKTTDPKLVLIIGWMDARELYLAKYVRQYQSLFPTSAILLFKSRLASVNLDRIARRDAKSAVDPLCAILGESHSYHASGSPELLVHVFSGGGSCMLHHLYDMYAAHTTATSAGADGPTNKLPLHVTLFDSAPAVFSYKATFSAVMLGVPSQMWIRSLAFPLAHLLVTAWWVRIHVLGLSDILATYARSHNDPNKVREARRTYIYSDVDKVVPAVDIENHATDAESKGFRVNREIFIGSGHVAHARKDPERYWRVVKDLWADKVFRGRL